MKRKLIQNKKPIWRFQNIKNRLWLLFILTFYFSFIEAQNFHLLKDINISTDANPENRNPGLFNFEKEHSFAVLNSITYFGADNGLTGMGLWRSDGTTAGTFQIKSGINPTNIVVANGKLFFLGSGNIGLWESDGTVAGTVPVLQVVPPGLSTFAPFCLTVLGNSVYFSISGHGLNDQLWKTNGTTEGTILIKDFYDPVYINAASDMFNLTTIKNKLYFSIRNANFSYNLAVSDGSSAGTHIVSNNVQEPAQMVARSSVPSDPWVYFSAGNVSRTLYLTNGESGVATPVTALNTLIDENYYTEEIYNIDSVLYFIGRLKTSGILDHNLYKFDPKTTSGAQLLKTFLGIGPTGAASSLIYGIKAINKNIYYVAADAVIKRNQLWKWDVSTSTNVLLKDTLGSVYKMYDGNGILYFVAGDSLHGREIWKSDGTQAGTLLIKDIKSNIGTFSSDPDVLTYANDKILFSAMDDIHGRELWQSDGTAAGTSLLKDINQSSTGGSNPRSLKALNYNLIFKATTATANDANRVRKSDGTNNGTLLVNDSINNIGADQDFLVVKKHEGYFWGMTATVTQGLYKIDSASNKVTLVKDFTSIPVSLYRLKATENLIYLYVYNSVTLSYELWRSDGTGANTFVINNNISINQNLMVASGEELFFVANYSSGLWKTDGTAVGTVLLKSFNFSLTNIIVNNGLVFFTVSDGTDYGLWKSDGTSAGTIQVTDNITNPNNLVSSNGQLFFTAVGNTGLFGVIGKELYKTDGTGSGTILIKDIHPGITNTSIFDPIVVNGLLYFFTNGTAGNEFEFWMSDGTTDGTLLIKTIGNLSPYPTIVSHNGKMFFIIDNQLWESDGSPLGTHVIADTIFLTLSISDYQAGLTLVNNQLFFAASAYKTGQELYVGNISAAVASFYSIADGNWNNPAIWNRHSIPPDSVNVIISTRVIGNKSALCNTLLIKSPGALTVNTGIKISVSH